MQRTIAHQRQASLSRGCLAVARESGGQQPRHVNTEAQGDSLRDMMASTTIELPDDLRAKAEPLARKTGRSLAEVLTGAVAHGLDHDL